MAEEPKDLEIVLSEEIQEQLANDPKMAAALKEMMSVFHQAHHAVQTGQYRTFDDALEALTGNRPEKIDPDTGDVLEGSSMHEDLGLGEEDRSDDGLRCSGLRPGNRCVHGFQASVACWPLSLEHAERTKPPMCLDEERCGDLFDNNGGKPYPQPWLPYYKG